MGDDMNMDAYSEAISTALTKLQARYKTVDFGTLADEVEEAVMWYVSDPDAIIEGVSDYIKTHDRFTTMDDMTGCVDAVYRTHMQSKHDKERQEEAEAVKTSPAGICHDCHGRGYTLHYFEHSASPLVRPCSCQTGKRRFPSKIEARSGFDRLSFQELYGREITKGEWESRFTAVYEGNRPKKGVFAEAR